MNDRGLATKTSRSGSVITLLLATVFVSGCRGPEARAFTLLRTAATPFQGVPRGTGRSTDVMMVSTAATGTGATGGLSASADVTAPADVSHTADSTPNLGSDDVSANHTIDPTTPILGVPPASSQGVPPANTWHDDQQTTFRHELAGFLPGVWRDARGLAHRENALILGVSLAAAIGLRQDADGEVRQYTAEHPQRWGDATEALGVIGEPQFQVPLLAAAWGTSLWADDPEFTRLMRTLVSAYTINGLAVLAVKGVSDTDRPDPDWNDGRWGFPSFHVASTFTVGAVLDEYYGPAAASPLYVLGGLIGWSRIDQRDHDLSDVVFGACLGYVIGRSVAGTHVHGDGRIAVMPWMHPTEPGMGFMLERRF